MSIEEVGNVGDVQVAMDQALATLDAKVTHEYWQALSEQPDLVTTETPATKFWRRCDGDATAAAERLAWYWKFRRYIFGHDRWLRSMHDVSGYGVLDERAVYFLQQGVFAYFSRPGTDGPVLVVNPYRQTSLTTKICEQLMFYLATCIDDPDMQTVGLCIIFAVTSQDSTILLPPKMTQYFAQGLPVRMRRFVVVQNYESEPQKQAQVQFLAVRTKIQIQQLYLADCPFKANPGLVMQLVGAGSSSQIEYWKSLQQANVPLTVLPTHCGGWYDENVLCDWIQQRLTLDQVATTIRPSVTPKRPAAQLDPQIRGELATQGSRKPRSVIAANALRYECDKLRQANQAVRHDNQRLERLLLRARQLVLEQEVQARKAALDQQLTTRIIVAPWKNHTSPPMMTLTTTKHIPHHQVTTTTTTPAQDLQFSHSISDASEDGDSYYKRQRSTSSNTATTTSSSSTTITTIDTPDDLDAVPLLDSLLEYDQDLDPIWQSLADDEAIGFHSNHDSSPGEEQKQEPILVLPAAEMDIFDLGTTIVSSDPLDFL